MVIRIFEIISSKTENQLLVKTVLKVKKPQHV